MLYIGNHTSSSRGYLAMGKQMLANGGNTFAFFTRNPRGGKAKDIDPQDVQATLQELTAVSVADAIRQYAGEAQRVLVCGGGVHNRALLARLQAQLPDLIVESTAVAGIDPDFVEAIGFAWLAKRTLDGLPGNVPAVTGARGERILGGIYRA